MLGPYHQTASNRDAEGKLTEIHLAQSWIVWLELSLTGLSAIVLILFKAYLGLPLIFLLAMTLLLRQYRLKIEEVTLSNQHRQILWRDTQGLIGRINFEQVEAFRIDSIKIQYNRNTKVPQDMLSLLLKNGQEIEFLRFPPEESARYAKHWQQLEFNPENRQPSPPSEQAGPLPRWLTYKQTEQGHSHYAWRERQSYLSCLSWFCFWIWAGFLAWRDTDGWLILAPYAWPLWGIAVLVAGQTLLRMGRQYWLDIGPQSWVWGISDFSGKAYQKGILAQEHALMFYWQSGNERQRRASSEDRDYNNYQMADDYRLYGMSQAHLYILNAAGAAEMIRKKNINQDLSIKSLLKYIAAKNCLMLPLPGFNLAETLYLMELLRQHIQESRDI